MAEDIRRGIVRPLDFKTFVPNEVEEAFRYMAAGKHIGKVLIKMRENQTDVATLPMNVSKNIHCFERESYIIVGGLGGFGLELADFLIIRGCKNLVISSSRGVTNGYQASRIK
jgi:fatty acid synthase